MKNVLRLMILLCMTALPALNRAQGWTNPMTLPGLGNGSLGDPIT